MTDRHRQNTFSLPTINPPFDNTILFHQKRPEYLSHTIVSFHLPLLLTRIKPARQRACACILRWRRSRDGDVGRSIADHLREHRAGTRRDGVHQTGNGTRGRSQRKKTKSRGCENTIFPSQIQEMNLTKRTLWKTHKEKQHLQKVKRHFFFKYFFCTPTKKD